MTKKQEEAAIKKMQETFGPEATARLYEAPQDYGKSGRGRCAVRRPDKLMVARWFAGETFEAAQELAQETEDEERAVNVVRGLYGPYASAKLEDQVMDLGGAGLGRRTVTRPGPNGQLVFAGATWEEAFAKAEPYVEPAVVLEEPPVVLEESPAVETAADAVAETTAEPVVAETPVVETPVEEVPVGVSIDGELREDPEDDRDAMAFTAETIADVANFED